MDDREIENVLTKWYDAKQEINALEAKISKYRGMINREMNRQEVNKLISDNYTVTQSRISRLSISKNDIPEDLWHKYATRTTYPAFTVRRRK